MFLKTPSILESKSHTTQFIKRYNLFSKNVIYINKSKTTQQSNSLKLTKSKRINYSFKPRQNNFRKSA